MSVLIRGMRIPLILCTFFSLSISLNAMEKKPYHHIYKDGKLYAFRNLEGGPKRDPNFKWDWKVFREEKKKLKICLLYTSPSPRDTIRSRMPSSA